MHVWALGLSCEAPGVTTVATAATVATAVTAATAPAATATVTAAAGTTNLDSVSRPLPPIFFCSSAECLGYLHSGAQLCTCWGKGAPRAVPLMTLTPLGRSGAVKWSCLSFGGRSRSGLFLPTSVGSPGTSCRDGEERGWIRGALLPLKMLSGPIQHHQTAIRKAWQLKVSAQLADRKGFLGALFLDISGSLLLLTSSLLRERDEMLFRSILCWGIWKGQKC